eukprot:3733735-Pyramimonas_sp.AAC.1
MCANVRLRARQALADSADADPWRAERPSAKIDKTNVMAEKSKHDMVKLKKKWSCTACRHYVTADARQEFVDAPCETTVVTASEIVDVKGDCVMGNG